MRHRLAKEAVIRDVGVRLEAVASLRVLLTDLQEERVKPALNAAQTQAGIAVSCYVRQPGGRTQVVLF